MQSSDGFGFETRPSSHSSPQVHNIPAGSRLNQYLGANRKGFPSNNSNNSSHIPLHVNAPPFVPKQQFSQLSLNEQSTQSQSSPSLRQPPPSTFVNNGTVFYYQDQDGEDNEAYDQPDPMVIPEGHIAVSSSGNFAYTAPLPHIGKFRPKGAVGNNQAQFMSQELKLELLNRQLALDAQPVQSAYYEVPAQVDHLNNLVPLENISTINMTQTTFKATSIRDGSVYCLRRIHGYRVQSPKQLHTLESWKKVTQCNIVQLREMIPNCRAFGGNDSSLVLIYDFCPLAETLKARHFDNKTGAFFDVVSGTKIGSSQHGAHSFHQLISSSNSGITETVLWNYVIQLSAALRCIHASGLAARSIDLSKIIVYGKRIMLSFCGILDILNPDSNLIQHQQMEDLFALGRLLVALATGSLVGARRDQLQQSMQYIQSHYSGDMKNLITYLLTPATNGRKSINDVMPMIGARFYNLMETMQQRNDFYEQELSKELENGRLFRVVSKLNTIVGRFEHNGDESWSETGDRFMIKLFVDYVFHQVMENGKPWLDMAHIVQCLNKLDAGSHEKIAMVSQDGTSQLVVSYSDLKRCMDQSFRDLSGSNVVLRH